MTAYFVSKRILTSDFTWKMWIIKINTEKVNRAGSVTNLCDLKSFYISSPFFVLQFRFEPLNMV